MKLGQILTIILSFYHAKSVTPNEIKNPINSKRTYSHQYFHRHFHQDFRERNSLGAIPVFFLKKRVKYDWSAKFNCSAISVTDK